MALIKPNLKDVQDLAAIPAGRYPAKVTAASPGVSKSGNDKVVLEIEITTPEFKAKRFEHLVIGGKGAYKFDNFLRAIHMEGLANKLRQGEEVALDTEDFVGQELIVSVKTTEEDGQKGDEISRYLKRD